MQRAFVAQQHRRLQPARDEEVEVAVAVIIARDDARRARCYRKARAHGAIDEVARAVVLEQRKLVGGRAHGNDVVVAVLVEVAERHAATVLTVAAKRAVDHHIRNPALQRLVIEKRHIGRCACGDCANHELHRAARG